MRRVVVTGLGAVCPIGNDVQTIRIKSMIPHLGLLEFASLGNIKGNIIIPFEYDSLKEYQNKRGIFIAGKGYHTKGIINLKKYVDTLVIIPNDKLSRFVEIYIHIQLRPLTQLK